MMYANQMLIGIYSLLLVELTFDISNLFTMLPQDEGIKILGEFLRTYEGPYVKNLSVTTIQKLAQIVLKHNAFVCDNKFYKQVVGGAMGSPFYGR